MKSHDPVWILAPRSPVGENAPEKVRAWGTTISAVKRYPFASTRSEREREMENCANSRTAVTRSVTKTIAVKQREQDVELRQRYAGKRHHSRECDEHNGGNGNGRPGLHCRRRQIRQPSFGVVGSVARHHSHISAIGHPPAILGQVYEVVENSRRICGGSAATCLTPWGCSCWGRRATFARPRHQRPPGDA